MGRSAGWVWSVVEAGMKGELPFESSRKYGDWDDDIQPDDVARALGGAGIDSRIGTESGAGLPASDAVDEDFFRDARSERGKYGR